MRACRYGNYVAEAGRLAHLAANALKSRRYGNFERRLITRQARQSESAAGRSLGHVPRRGMIIVHLPHWPLPAPQ